MRDLCQGLSSLEAVRTGVKGTDLQGDQPWHPHTSGNEKNLEDHVTTRYPVGCLGRPRLFQNRPPLNICLFPDSFGRIVRSMGRRDFCFRGAVSLGQGLVAQKSNWTTPSTWVISYVFDYEMLWSGPWGRVRPRSRLSHSRPRNTNPNFVNK